MHTYRKSKRDELWTVGHYQMIGYQESSSEQIWCPMRDFKFERDAASYVNYLNGGEGDYFDAKGP